MDKSEATKKAQGAILISVWPTKQSVHTLLQVILNITNHLELSGHYMYHLLQHLETTHFVTHCIYVFYNSCSKY
jgi:hypothetical protein